MKPDDVCPGCGVTLIGDPIPEKDRIHSSPPYHYRREIAIYSMESDRTVAYGCPDCWHQWPRAVGKETT